MIKAVLIIPGCLNELEKVCVCVFRWDKIVSGNVTFGIGSLTITPDYSLFDVSLVWVQNAIRSFRALQVKL